LTSPIVLDTLTYAVNTVHVHRRSKDALYTC